MTSRRGALRGIAAAGAGLALAPVFAAAAPRALVRPPRLRQGDVVGLAAPAGFVADRFGVEELEAAVRAMGLVPRSASNLLARSGYLAGADEVRAAALNALYRDPQVRAIFAVRGGWGSQRILPLLDYAAIAARPRLLVGSSDVTALHLAIAARTGLAGIHGPNLAASWNAAAWDAFRRLAFDGALPTYALAPAEEDRLVPRGGRIRTLRRGTARGRLLGGNLSVLAALVGTPFLPDFAGAILFLEDTNESEYRIDRLLTQLGQSGVLGKLAGVVFGQCTNCTNPGEPFGNFTIYEVLDRHLGTLGVPAFQGALIGHIANQISVPANCLAEIDADAGTIRVLESAVV